jgi:hypothetical protein
MSDNHGKINVSVANLYSEANYRSEVINQGLLGEQISIENRLENFTKIKLSDGYQGWISNYQWVSAIEHSLPMKTIRNHFNWIYKKPDIKSEVLRDATIGSVLPIMRKIDHWFEILLPDGLTGWIPDNTFADFPDTSRQGVLKMVNEFKGYPYFWGGRSAKGFDCSGLVQTVFSLIGMKLPRDSWMQQQDGKYVTDNPEKAKPGDLYFFSDTGSKITHVGITLGKGRIIHARGMVKENSLNRKDENFSENLYNSFVDVRTYF